MLKIQILIDNVNSWIIPYGRKLEEELKIKGNEVTVIHDHQDITEGDILCMLSCERILKKMNLNKHNLVVHESNLPKGKGWSPVTWQVLEGKDKIPVTLFEASDKVDSGVIYSQDFIYLNGTELIDEIRHKQGLITKKLILEFINNYPNNKGIKQIGESSFYPKRTFKDSEIKISESLVDNINLLRVCDNERYPAYFMYKGQKYIIKIYKA